MVICIDLGATEIKVAPVEKINGIVTFGKVDKVSTNANAHKRKALPLLRQGM